MTSTTSKGPSQADFYASLCSNTHHHEPSTTHGASRFDRIAAQGVARDPPSNCYTAAITRTPHSTSFQDPGSFLCVGALVAPNLVLTTATCVSRLFGQDLKGFKVVLNSDVIVHPMFGYTTGATYRDIEELAIHEEYGVKSGGFFLRVNDVAVVKLSPEEGNGNSTSSSSCSVCLPFAQPSGHVWRDCVVSGYSHPTSMTAEPSSSTLHSAAQFIETDKVNCETAIENYSPGAGTGGKLRTEHLNDEQDTLTCASGVEKAEACFSPRDAGSPLVCRNDRGDYALVGLFSSGFHCGTKELPVLYTNVGLFESWVGRFLTNSS